MHSIKSSAQRERMEPCSRRRSSASAVVYDFNAPLHGNAVSRRIKELEDENGKLARMAAQTTVEVTALRVRLRDDR